MDPFNEDSENTTGGDLYINLGNVSEDVLNDSQLEFENGSPSINNPDQDTDTSALAIYPDPSIFNVVNAFDNTSGSYEMQDVGIDGMKLTDEREFFSEWLEDLEGLGVSTPEALSLIENDPSADDFEYFRNSSSLKDLNILERYKKFSRYEGNSNTARLMGILSLRLRIQILRILMTSSRGLERLRVITNTRLLRPSDLGEINVGTNYITDVYETFWKVKVQHQMTKGLSSGTNSRSQ